MNVIDITKNLISIPSFVDQNDNEEELAQWIENYLLNNSKLKIERQFIGKNRFNLTASNTNQPDILIVAHMDTVRVQNGWKTDPFNPKVKDGEIYGLGSSDMKGGIAAILKAISLCSKIKKVMFLFYCDEEYNFTGMKKFILDYQEKIKPKLVVSADGSNKIGNSCRGLIELLVEINGKSGHSAFPKSGINAISKSYEVISAFSKWLKQFKTKDLGKSTLNLAYISGGSNNQANVIPDNCKIVLEIRSADLKLNAKRIKIFFKKEAKKLSVQIKISIKHDLKPWITPRDEISRILGKKSLRFLKAEKRGYVDLQMLYDAFGKVPCLTYGAGEENAAHKANEYVKINNLKKVVKFYRNLIENERAR